MNYPSTIWTSPVREHPLSNTSPVKLMFTWLQSYIVAVLIYVFKAYGTCLQYVSQFFSSSQFEFGIVRIMIFAK